MESGVDSIIAEFGHCELGDLRRNQRAGMLAAQQVVQAGRSLAQTCGTWRDAKAAYRLLRNEAVTPDALLVGHRKATAARAMGCRVVLAAQDTTTMSHGHREPIDGMGPVDSDLRVQGFLVHSSLLIDPESNRVLGVAAQKIWARSWTPAPKGESGAERKKRSRESEHWAGVQEGVAEAFGRTGIEDGSWSPAAEGTPHIIAVFDREGDIFEAMESLVSLGHGFVIRAIRDRKLKAPAGEIDHSFTAVEQAPELGRVTFDVPRRPGKPTRSATLAVRARSMMLLPPANRGRKGAPLPVSMVLISEVDPPANEEPVEWYLVTTEPCTTLTEALTVVRYYRFRWRVEEFHMGLKSGCGAERVQLESFHALTNYVAISSVAAWKLLTLRDEARSDAVDVASEILNEVQKAILRVNFPRLASTPTAKEWLRAVAMLGGFFGRKSDGEPGWRTLWWGWKRLELLETGWRSALANSGYR